MKHRAKAGALLTGTEWEAVTTHLEAVTTVAATGATETLDASAASVYDLTLDQACTFTLSGATDDEAAVLTVILRGAFGTTWPASVTWLNGSPPAVALRVATLFSVDGGTNWYGTSSRSGGPLSDVEYYTGGDVALTSTSMIALPGPGDLSVAAAAGDVLLIDLSARTANTTNASIGLDIATMVSGSAVTYMSSRTGTPVTTGRPAWFLEAAQNGAAGGSCTYVLQSGDVSGGTVTLRLFYRVSSNRTIGASSGVPLEFSVVNLGQ